VSAVISAIRRIVAEDAAHRDTTHEVYLTPKTVNTLAAGRHIVRDQARRPPTVCGLPVRVQNVGRDCIATIRGGKIICVTNL
jgi:hypothetical protein